MAQVLVRLTRWWRADEAHEPAKHVRDVKWVGPQVPKERFAADVRTYLNLPGTLRRIVRARAADERLVHVARTGLPPPLPA